MGPTHSCWPRASPEHCDQVQIGPAARRERERERETRRSRETRAVRSKIRPPVRIRFIVQTQLPLLRRPYRSATTRLARRGRPSPSTATSSPHRPTRSSTASSSPSSNTQTSAWSANSTTNSPRCWRENPQPRPPSPADARKSCACQHDAVLGESNETKGLARLEGAETRRPASGPAKPKCSGVRMKYINDLECRLLRMGFADPRWQLITLTKVL